MLRVGSISIFGLIRNLAGDRVTSLSAANSKMADYNEKSIDSMNNHGIDDHNKQGERRGSNLGEKVRTSISVQHSNEGVIEGQVFSMNDVDPVLDQKMRLVNRVSPFQTARGVSNAKPDHRRDWMDQLPPQAVLP